MKLIIKIIGIILFIVIDIFLWILIGLILLNYEDNWTEDKGQYFSLASMSWTEKIAYVSYYLWIIGNVILVLFLILKGIKKYIIKT